MPLTKRSRDGQAGSFQKQQPPTKRHKPSGTQPADPLDQSAQGDAEPEEVDLEAQEASVKTYLHHAVKLLVKALKASKQFESQKLARKLKQAREPKNGTANEADAADAEAQLNALKAISPHTFAPVIISTRIAKLGFLRQHAAALQASLATPSTSNTAEPSGQSAEGKARNRLMAHKAVKDAWDEITRALSKRMGKEVEPRPVKEKPAPAKLKQAAPTAASSTTAAPTTTTAGGTEGEAGPVKRLSKRALRTLRAQEMAKLPKPSIKMDPARAAALARAEEVEHQDDEQEVDRVGEAESEDEGPISGSEYGDDDDEIAREIALLGGEGGDDWSSAAGSQSAQSDADDSDDDAAFAPAKATKADKSIKARQTITASAFLPSLASGYVSYSDSDGESAKWVKEAEKGEKKERKNRRGQRARQAIWEQKYGSGARHIAKANGTKPAPTKGKGASQTKKDRRREEEADAQRLPFDPARVVQKPWEKANPNAMPLIERKVARPPPKVMSGEKMHPSWEAKKRAAAQAEIGAAAPKGKKITFD